MKELKKNILVGNIIITERDITVLKRLAEGDVAKKIAGVVFTGVKNIELIKRNMYKATGTKNDNSLIAWAFRNKVIE